MTFKKLVGTELLDLVKKLGDSVPKTELARQCGYITVDEYGNEKVEFSLFYEELLKAKGLTLPVTNSSSNLSMYETEVSPDGSIVISKMLSTLVGFKRGQKLEIKLGGGGLRLYPINK